MSTLGFGPLLGRKPPLPLAATVCGIIAASWIVLRILVLRGSAPLTYVIPLLGCVWARDRRVLWALIPVFAVAATIEILWVVPHKEAAKPDYTVLAATLVNILAGGGITHLILSLRDRVDTSLNELAQAVAELQKSEGQLRRTGENLARSNRDLEQFAYIASHDLQEPLRIVAGYVQLLERRYRGRLDAEADKFIAYAVDGATRMKTLIGDLLTYSRVGTRDRALAQVDCDKVLRQALDNLGQAIAETETVVKHERLPAVRGDESQLIQLFQNLVGNAIKFRDPARKAEIHVRARREGSNWLFQVQDNGIGMEPQYHERIFQIFQRLHDRGKYPGTGIGLAVCKRIVERHGGRIWAESQLGNGTTFFFTISDEVSIA